MKAATPSSLSNSPRTTRRLATLIHHLRNHTSFEDKEEGKKEKGVSASSKVGLPPHLRRAAVLTCLFEGLAGDLRVILTKRSPRLSTHSGEVSLPGGKAEEGDADDSATALREAREEIGLESSLVTVVKVHDPIVSKRFPFRIVPVIGILADRQSFKPVINADEV